MNILFYQALVMIFLVACNAPTSKTKEPDATDTTARLDDRFNDTTKVLVAELPVQFDSTEILIFPIGLVDLNERKGYKIDFSSSDYGKSDNFSVSSYDDTFSGDIINLIFENKTGKQSKLTNHKVRITSVTFLRQIYEETGQQYLLYSLVDRDSNRDQKFDYQDVSALYLSNLDGSNFKKLTHDRHEFYDYNIMGVYKKMYFRTLEDRNRDDVFNNKDIFHYYRIDFSSEGYEMEEINPLQLYH
ncbi:MAG: hypothetical protein ACOYXT_12940 [Bacteroidota bacterium]